MASERLNAAIAEMAKQDITFANCDSTWQKRVMTAVLAAADTRAAPAATDTGLVTVGEVSTVRESVAAFAGHMSSGQLKPGDLLCLRSQAVELLAAERTETERLADDYQAIREQLHRGWQECCALKADNAAQAARIKELEAALDSDPDGSGLWRFWSKKSVEAHQQLRDKTKTIKALEANLETYHEEYENRKEGYEKTINSLEEKLAAAREALEPFADHAKERAVDAPEWRDTDTVQIVVTIGDLRAARAVLGGKPS